MAEKKEVTEQPKPDVGTALAPQTSASALVADLGDDFMRDVAANSGAGVSMDAADSLVPFLSILQDLSPQTQRRKPEYIEGAEVGMLFLNSTRTVIPSGEIEVQPCYFEKVFVEWIPRDNGGGLVARHKEIPREAKTIPDPKSPDRKTKIVMPNGNEIIETRYHYVNIIYDDGRITPAVMGMSSTAHTSSRAWMALMKEAILPVNGIPTVAPSWFRTYVAKSTIKKNAQGEWFVWEFRPKDWVRDRGLREMGKRLHEAIAAGELKAGAEDQASSEAAGETPF